MKSLVIYYSRAGENYVDGKIISIEKGNTEYIAEFIRDNFNADLFKVETVKEYSKNYLDCIKEAQKELDNDIKPELKNYLFDLSTYDTIFIAGPNWWGTYPMPLFSAIEKLDFNGKKVYPIITHEGSRLGHCMSDLKRVLIGCELIDGLAIKGSECKNSEKTVIQWIKNN